MIPELRKVAQLNSKYCIEKNGGTIIHVCTEAPPDKVTALHPGKCHRGFLTSQLKIIILIFAFLDGGKPAPHLSAFANFIFLGNYDDVVISVCLLQLFALFFQKVLTVDNRLKAFFGRYS